ncbi:glycosyltransferase [Lichenicoccus sp.]|uniref:glycosyltransferase n=1 Tax=Lichenicoccus sp. TaxID=2781899 RepID=UPI003D132862
MNGADDNDHTPQTGHKTGHKTGLKPDPAQLRDSYRNSLLLQQMRIATLQAALEERAIRVEGLEASLSWRITLPIRLARSLAAGRLPSGLKLRDILQRARDIQRDEGAAGLRRHLRRRLQRRRTPEPDASARLADIQVALSPVLHRSMLIIAELSVAQCAKYRVWQKQEMLATLGWPCVVIDWHDSEAARSALQCCTEVIFYRVPATQAALSLIQEARRCGLHSWWEVDDLIFDEPLYRLNSNLATLTPALREEVLSGIRLYRAAMLACGRAIASTPVLAQCMRDAGVAEVACIENALDDETIEIARTLAGPRAAPAAPMIVYGSGTKTHDADFATAAGALARLMRTHPTLRLRIIGDLALPVSLDGFASRIERLPSTTYRAYLRLLSQGDIAIAPLEDSLFNDAKSNIKFQEAAILAMPAVCAPRAAFRDIVVVERNGLLAQTPGEWEQALDRLIRDPGLRTRLGEAARDDVRARYAPRHIAQTQLAPLFGPTITDRASRPLRVLMVNVFLWPRSFGGATIVAEELARSLHDRDDTEIAVFTSRGEIDDRPESLLRYDWNGIAVFAAPLPQGADHVAGFDNPAAVRAFASVLDAVRPDIVHAHSIQGLGAGILRLCQERGIPYVITLHDAWWLCDRQFMVRGDRNYCFQTRIDLRVCQACVPHARHLEARAAILRQVLDHAAHLLSPSESHRALYLANSIPPDRISVNRNGIRRPTRQRSTRPPGSVPRFGFVGGNEAIKGFPILRLAFETIRSDRWELVLVDNTLNLGFSSIDTADWHVPGQVRVVPAYDQDTIDTFFDGIDVLLFPSQWKESYGLTVREALARDVWVIATSPGGQSEDIVDGVNGRLIALDGRADGLIAAIEEILNAPGRLDGYVNPHGAALADYETQAVDLREVLGRAAANPQDSSEASAATRSRVSNT